MSIKRTQNLNDKRFTQVKFQEQTNLKGKSAVVKKRVIQETVLFFDTAENHNPQMSSTRIAQQKTGQTTLSTPHAGGH